MLNTEDFYQDDTCPCFRTYASRYEPLRISLNGALHEALNAAFIASSPIAASEKVIELATRPGIDIESKNLYDSVIHHARLVEVLAAYTMAIGKLSVPPSITCEWGDFQPSSFLTPDGRLRRIILCDRWTVDREALERFSWRTTIDCVLTNRPMVLTALAIGSVRNGFRPSPWTQGFEHPQSGEIRIKKREGKFVDSWREVYREQTDLKAMDWLRIMQSDGAFEGRVFSIVQELPANRDGILGQIGQMAEEIHSHSMRQTRSNCYRFRPCPFLPACVAAKSPAQMGWVEKNSLSEMKNGILSLTI